jgi:RecA/RadA recombinase
LNIAFSGDLDGGFMPGLSMIAGESRTFKSVISLVCAKAYMDKYDDAIMLFYDSEMGASKNYFNSLDIDLERVLHIPITDVEQFKFDVMAQLEEIKRGDHVIIVVDSIGNLASKKEVEDALNEKSAADMSRAKALKSLTRLITPHLNLKNIPMIVVNHTYQTLEIYSKTITGGGSGLVYASDNILNITRSQQKNGTEIVGYDFNINVLKSRHSREKSRIPITVMFDSGINVWSGLLEMAVASGDVVKPSNGWYQVVDVETGEMVGNKVRAKDTNNKEFWDEILKRQHFKDWVKKTFMIANSKLLSDDKGEGEMPDSQFTME